MDEDELDEKPVIESIMGIAGDYEEEEEKTGSKFDLLKAGPEKSPAAPQAPGLQLDPHRRADDPFAATRDDRLLAMSLYPDDISKQENFVSQGNQQRAAMAQELSNSLTNGGYLKRSPNRAWQLQGLAKAEKANRAKQEELALMKQHKISDNYRDLAMIEKQGLQLKIDDAYNKQVFHEKTAGAVTEEMDVASRRREKYNEKEEKVLGLMDRLYAGYDHALDHSSGIFDIKDTISVQNADGDWEVKEEYSGTGIAATAAAAAGIAANFLLTIASEGKVPMVMDRLVFGIVDRSLRGQKALIQKYRQAGQGVQTLYGTLLATMENERAADSAYYAMVYRRIEQDYGAQAARAEGATARNGYEIGAKMAVIERQKWEMATTQAIKQDVSNSIAKEANIVRDASTADAQWRSGEAQRLALLRDMTSAPAEVAARYSLNTTTSKWTKEESKRVQNFNTNMNLYSKAIMLIEDLQDEYGGFLGEDIGSGGEGQGLGAWIYGKGEEKYKQLKKRMSIAWVEDHGGQMNAEYALNEFGKLAAQQYGKDKDTGNMAVEELVFWIDRFFQGHTSLSVLRSKLIWAMSDEMTTAAVVQKAYETDGMQKKAAVLAEVILDGTNNVYKDIYEYRSQAMNPSTKGRLWNDYYIKNQQENATYWDDLRRGVYGTVDPARGYIPIKRPEGGYTIGPMGK